MTSHRVLFVMQYPAYLRLFASVVRLLGERGHDVRLAFDKPDANRSDSVELASAYPNAKVVGMVPAHGGPFRDLLVDVGCTTDYVRYLSPRFAHAGYLRKRIEKHVPPQANALTRVERWPDWLVRLSFGASRLAERALPVDPALVAFLREQRPSVLVITPLVLRGPGGVQQTQLVKAAQRLGIPVALAVGSWDHLSSKGMIRVDPDVVILWNDAQRREAIELHGVAAERIVVTGAQPFDHWFDMRPVCSRDEFFARVALPPAPALIVYVGSSRAMALGDREVAFVRQWIGALRKSTDPRVRDAAVLVRPHPSNMDAWQAENVRDLPGVCVYPRARPSFPMTPTETKDYFHSIYFSDAIVGINTSAMIEATILDRQVYTLRVPEYETTQEGTLHFQYLVPEGGGCARSAHDFREHLEQLRSGLADAESGRAERSAFVRSFVRPYGLEQAATPLVVDAIERAAAMQPRPVSDAPLRLAPLRAVLRLMARQSRAAER